MQGLWTTSSTGLPHEGQAIEFLLDDRTVALDGTYDRQTFHSRWTRYDVGRVKTWRSMARAATGIELHV